MEAIRPIIGRGQKEGAFYNSMVDSTICGG
jgi:hypothetical protein